MKAPERALTEWVSDDILFNYADGRGPQHHNRDQFIKVCNVLRAGNENAAPEDVTSQTQQPLQSGGIVQSGQIINPVNFSGFIGARGVSGTLMHHSTSKDWEIRRTDISKVVNWGVVQRVHAASATFRSMLETKLSISESWLDSQIRGFFDPRKIAQFENAREIIDRLIRLGQSIAIKGS